MVAGEAGIVRAGSHREAGLGREQQLIAAAAQRLADDLLRAPSE